MKHVLDDSESTVLIYDQRFSGEITRIHVAEADDIASFEYEQWIADFPQREPVLAEPLHELETSFFYIQGGQQAYLKELFDHIVVYIWSVSCLVLSFRSGAMGKA